MVESEGGLRRSVYIETSILGHLTALLSRDLVTAGHQELTQEWNCAHIANIERRELIEEVCRDSGYEPPAICTPEQLMG